MSKTGGGSRGNPGFRRLLLKRSKEVLRQRRRACRRGDPAAVHDLRVATRRLQEALDFFAPSLPARPRRRLARRARLIRRSLGEVRNADVMVELLRGFARSMPPKDRARLRRLAGRLESEARVLRRPAAGRRGLRIAGIRKRIGALLDRARSTTRPAAGGRAPGVVQDRLRAVRRALPGARTGAAEAIHRLRIAIKKYRYALEIVEESGLGKVSTAIETARGLQGRLGHLHDLDVLIGLVRRSEADAGRGALLSRLARERRDAAATVLAALQRFRPSAETPS